MYMIEALKSGWHRNLHVSNGDRRLYWDDECCAWAVYGPQYGKIMEKPLVLTEDAVLAIKYLLYQEM